MRVNYKFQVQVTIPRLTFYLDKSVDIEVSTFDKFGDEPFIKNLTDDALNLYNAYFNLPFDKLAKDLDYLDLNFLLFIETVHRSKLSDLHFDGSFIPVCRFVGEGFEFVFLVNEG